MHKIRKLMLELSLASNASHDDTNDRTRIFHE